MHLPSVYLAEGAHFREALETHWSDFWKGQKRASHEFDPLILELLTSAFPSQMIHAIALVETGRVSESVNLVIPGVNTFPHLQTVARAVTVIKRKQSSTVSRFGSLLSIN
jgi:hypothetical protein